MLNPEIRQTRTQLRNFPPTQVIVGPRQPPSPISKLLITMCPRSPGRICRPASRRCRTAAQVTGPGNYTLACCPHRHGPLRALSIRAINPLEVSNLSLLSPGPDVSWSVSQTCQADTRHLLLMSALKIVLSDMLA